MAVQGASGDQGEKFTDSRLDFILEALGRPN